MFTVLTFRYLNGAYTIKVRFFGQEIAVGKVRSYLVLLLNLMTTNFGLIFFTCIAVNLVICGLLTCKAG
jgi:hypothetical protein